MASVHPSASSQRLAGPLAPPVDLPGDQLFAGPALAKISTAESVGATRSIGRATAPRAGPWPTVEVAGL
jgi:hypothetical protein